MTTRVGSLVFDTTQGLSILAKAFYDHGVVTDVCVVEHGSRPSNRDWYPGKLRVGDLRSSDSLNLLKGFCLLQDVMLFFETPFLWPLIDYCRSRGVKTVLMPMYECMPKILPAQPDLFLCPSLLDLSYYPGEYEYKFRVNPGLKEEILLGYPSGTVTMDSGKVLRKSIYIPVPVEVPWRQRTRAEVFVHNAGHGGLKGRNGTKELVEALWHVKSKATIVIHTQEFNLEWERKVAEHSGRVDVHYSAGTKDYTKLWDDGDVFVFPEKFNGLSLPLQEARAAGMLVMGTDRFPMNMWLPRESLIPARAIRAGCNISPRLNDFDEAVIEPQDLARHIDEWYGRDITGYSLQGKRWAEDNSWEVLGPKYREVLESLVNS